MHLTTFTLNQPKIAIGKKVKVKCDNIKDDICQVTCYIDEHWRLLNVIKRTHLLNTKCVRSATKEHVCRNVRRRCKSDRSGYLRHDYFWWLRAFLLLIWFVMQYVIRDIINSKLIEQAEQLILCRFVSDLLLLIYFQVWFFRNAKCFETIQ